MTLPVADQHARVISPEITAYYHRPHKLVEARFSFARTYDHPEEAPLCARLRFDRGVWQGDVEISRFAVEELAALELLDDALRANGFAEQPALTETIEELGRLLRRERPRDPQDLRTLYAQSEPKPPAPAKRTNRELLEEILAAVRGAERSPPA